MLIPVKSLEPFLAHNEDPIYVSFYSCFVAVLMMMTSSYKHYLMNKPIDYWATKGFLGPWGTLLINEIMSKKVA